MESDYSTQTVAAVFVAGLVVAFGAGYLVSGSGMTGQMTAGESGEAVSEETIRERIQGMMDSQMERQRQQMQLMANQSENISMDDLEMDATVSSIESSDYGSLLEVTVTMSGTIPARTGGLRSIDQDQSMYISQDGRYVFQQPTDLEQPQQGLQQGAR